MHVDRKRLSLAIKLGLERASGKDLLEATQVLVEALSLVLDISDPDPPLSEEPVDPKPKPETRPSTLPPPIHDLAPIGEPDARSKRERSYYSLSDIQQIVIENSPPFIEISIDGLDQPATLNRSVSQLNADSGGGGVQLAYTHPKAEYGMPYPKATFWTTSEEVDVPSALDKIRRDASEIYRIRTTPIQTKAPIPPANMFAIGGDA